MNVHIPDIGGAIADRLNTLMLHNIDISVHTRDGNVGKIIRADVLRGKVVIKTSQGEVTARGNDVASLNTPLS